MKNIKFSTLTLLTVLFTFFIFISCEKDQENLSDNKNEQLLSKKSIDFLNNKMSNFEVFEINNAGSEYFFANVKSNNKIGYLITNKNQEKVIAFISFDLINKTTTIYDYIKDVVATSENLNLYNTTDFNSFVNDINNQDSARRFWGWECRNEVQVGGQCYRFCEYFILGISNGGSSYPCNDLPGSNPKLIDAAP